MPRNNQDGAAPWVRVEHVQVTNNIVRHAPAGLSILDPSRTASDIVVRNNLFSDLSSAYGGAGGFLLITGGQDITIDHNTVFQDGGSVVYAYGASTLGFAFTNNIVPDNAAAVMGDGSSAGNGTIQRYFAGGVWLGNVVAGAPASSYPGGNYYPASMAAVGFVNLARGNYRLAATSAYRNLATDGTNPGYDADALTATVPPSLLLCPANPPVVSPFGSPVEVTFASPILAAGAAPTGVTCAPLAGSVFPMGTTTVTCATVDLLARTASCSTAVLVQLPPVYSSGSVPTFAAVSVARRIRRAGGGADRDDHRGRGGDHESQSTRRGAPEHHRDHLPRSFAVSRRRRWAHRSRRRPCRRRRPSWRSPSSPRRPPTTRRFPRRSSGCPRRRALRRRVTARRRRPARRRLRRRRRRPRIRLNRRLRRTARKPRHPNRPRCPR